jgi:hypothetical protein
MNLFALVVLAGAVLCDVIGQLCFKVGLARPMDAGSPKPVWRGRQHSRCSGRALQPMLSR